jgi:hypothetical protein
MTDLKLTDYSEKAIVVRGDTKEWKEGLKELGGKYNANLRDGGGWIFPKKIEDKVMAFISSGKVPNDKNKFSFSKSTVKTNVKPTMVKPSSDKPISAKPTTVKNSEFISQVKQHYSTLNADQRLQFLSVLLSISNVENDKEVEEDIIEDDEEEEEEKPRKRLLG